MLGSVPLEFAKLGLASSSIAAVHLDLLNSGDYDLISTDLFDTVLLRDLSSEQSRFDQAARTAASRLGLDPARISSLRRSIHKIAYRAVAAERPLGDVSLRAICRAMALTVGAGDDVAAILEQTEVETDIAHLAPNRDLLAIYGQIAAAGKRVIAITDTYYSERDIGLMLDRVIGPHPIERVYASCELGLTKHAGALFAEVARREGVSPDRMLHLGDDKQADDVRARAAGLQVIHLPRQVTRRRVGKLLVRIAHRLGRAGDTV